MSEENTVEKAYTLRELRDDDLWPLLDILGKVFPDELSVAFAQVATGEKRVDEIGAEIMVKLVSAVLKNMGKVRGEVYEFLSGVTGIPADVIPGMKFGTTPKMVWDIARDVKNADFFKELSKSL